ncbi:MAG: N-acetylmuramoyl-L-alanine amidase, partial [Solirubrobacteraceae bacterium]
LRARALGGRWSPWAIASVRGHDPDRRRRAAGAAGASEPLFGEPLWFGGADALQLRTSARVVDLRVHLVAPGRSPLARAAADARRQVSVSPYPLASPTLDAGPGQPPIIARRAWAGRGHGPTAGPYYGGIELAFVHHTESPNGYGVYQVPEIMLSIYYYHVHARGFYDIAYNFMIDAFGRIWEARAGGIDEPVIGAQAGGYNAVSTGVAVIGSFMYAVPPAAAVQALERLLAWKLSLHGRPTTGRVAVEVNPADAFYTPFRPGQIVSLPRIAGHRDGDMTDCPGNAFYARLPSIRPRAHKLAGGPSLLTLSAVPETIAPSTPATLSGRLTTLAGEPIGGARLGLQTVAGVGVTTTFATAVTAPDGRWSADFTPDLSQVVRALHPGSPAAVSNLVLVGLAPTITLWLGSDYPLRVSGTVTPAKPFVTISVYRAGGGRHRRPVATFRTRVRKGEFSARISLGSRARGRYVIVASTGADVRTVASESPPLGVAL